MPSLLPPHHLLLYLPGRSPLSSRQASLVSPGAPTGSRVGWPAWRGLRVSCCSAVHLRPPCSPPPRCSTDAHPCVLVRLGRRFQGSRTCWSRVVAHAGGVWPPVRLPVPVRPPAVWSLGATGLAQHGLLAALRVSVSRRPHCSCPGQGSCSVCWVSLRLSSGQGSLACFSGGPRRCCLRQPGLMPAPTCPAASRPQREVADHPESGRGRRERMRARGSG